MALQGALLADFSSFTKACDDAVVKLVDFQSGSNKVEASLNRMSDSFSGRKIVTEATQMAEVFKRTENGAGLTTAELQRMGAVGQAAVEKLRALGKDIPPGIQAIADQAKKTGDSFSEFAGKFNIKDAITNPVGTAKDGMLAFAETLGPTGVALGAAGIAAAAMGGALFKLASDAAAVGAGLGDMADKTGLSVPALSRMSNAAQVIGADMGTLTDVVFKLQKGIGENSAEFQAGLGKMGLSTAELKAAGPDRYLDLVTAGLQGITDPAARAAAGTAVLGKGYKDVAAALLDLDAGMQLTADLTPWTAEQAAAAEAFEQQIASVKAHLGDIATTVGSLLIPAMSGAVTFISHVGEGLVTMANLGGLVSEGWHLITGALGETALAAQTVAAVTDAATRLWAQQGATADSVAAQMLTLGYSQQTVAEQTGLGAEAVKTMAGDLAMAKTEAEAYTAVWDRVNVALAAGAPSIATVSASTKGLVADMRAAGVSVEDMAAAAGLSVPQIKLLETAQDAAAAASKKLADELEKAATDAAKKFAGAVLEVESAGMSAAATLLTMDGAVVEGIKSSLAAGVSQAALAIYYGVTAAQVKAVATEMAAGKTRTDEQTGASQKLAAAMAALKNAGDGWKATLDTIDGSVVEAIKYYLKAGVSQGELATAYGLTAAQIAAVASALKGETEEQKASAAASDKNTEAKKREADSVRTLAGEYISAAEAKKRFDSGGSATLSPLSAQALEAFGGRAGIEAIVARGRPTTPRSFDQNGLDDLIQRQKDYDRFVEYLARVPRGANGFSNFPGGQAIVGERGPELVNLPRGSDVIPYGQGSGGGVTQHVVIHVNGTAADVARQVAAELMKTASLGRKFGST